MKQAFLGLDCGTSNIKCLAVDESGRQLAVASRFHATISERPGWMEQDPVSWLPKVIETISECSAAIPDYKVKAIALSGHMSSPVFLNQQIEPVYNCMTVGDARCEAEAIELIEQFGGLFKVSSGNKPMACFVPAKILYFKKNRPELYNQTAYMVMAKDYIRYQLTGLLNTDPTDAGNILLYDYSAGEWNYELIDLLQIKREIFPPVVDSMAQTGILLPEIAKKCGLGEDVAVYCGGADMACSHIGTASFEKQILAVTLSTSGQVCTTVDYITDAVYGKLTLHPGVLPNNFYAMGSVFSGGLALNWFYELLSGKKELSSAEYNEMLRLSYASEQYMPSKSEILFLPFLTGSGSPYFRSTDRAAFVGISTASNQEAMFAAVIEGVCFHIQENIEAFYDLGCSFQRVHLSGGGTKNRQWIQVLSDVTGLEIDVLECPDASTIGAAYIALAGSKGIDIREIAYQSLRVIDQVLPRTDRTECYRKLFPLYKKLYTSMSEIERELAALREKV